MPRPPLPSGYLRVGYLLLNRATGVYRDSEGRKVPAEAAQLEHGRLLRFAREGKGFTQAELAGLIGMSANHYARLERGDLPIGVQTHLALCAVLGLEVGNK